MSHPQMSAEQFAAECDVIIDRALPMVRDMLGEGTRAQVLAALALLVFSHIGADQLRSIAASAMVRIADEQAYSAKTASNFEEYAESTAETLADLRAEVAALRQQLAAVTRDA